MPPRLTMSGTEGEPSEQIDAEPDDETGEGAERTPGEQ